MNVTNVINSTQGYLGGIGAGTPLPELALLLIIVGLILILIGGKVAKGLVIGAGFAAITIGFLWIFHIYNIVV